MVPKAAPEGQDGRRGKTGFRLTRRERSSGMIDDEEEGLFWP